MDVTAPTPTRPQPLLENESTYQREPLPDGWTRFVIQPARGPRPIAIVWLLMAVFPVFLGVAIIHPFWPGFGFISMAILTLYLARLWIMTSWSDKRQPGGAFDVGAQGIRLRNGHIIPKAQVMRVLYRNALSGHGPSPAFVVTHGPLAGFNAATQNVGHAQQQRDYLSFVPIAFRLEVEAAGRATILCGGMTEATAYGVYNEVATILGLNDRRILS